MSKNANIRIVDSTFKLVIMSNDLLIYFYSEVENNVKGRKKYLSTKSQKFRVTLTKTNLPETGNTSITNNVALKLEAF